MLHHPWTNRDNHEDTIPEIRLFATFPAVSASPSPVKNSYVRPRVVMQCVPLLFRFLLQLPQSAYLFLLQTAVRLRSLRVPSCVRLVPSRLLPRPPHPHFLEATPHSHSSLCNILPLSKLPSDREASKVSKAMNRLLNIPPPMVLLFSTPLSIDGSHPLRPSLQFKTIYCRKDSDLIKPRKPPDLFRFATNRRSRKAVATFQTRCKHCPKGNDRL